MMTSLLRMMGKKIEAGGDTRFVIFFFMMGEGRESPASTVSTSPSLTVKSGITLSPAFAYF
jgi:hypothetical protein